MSIARAAAIGSLVVAIIAVGVLMFGGGGGTEYTVRMQTANQLVKGNEVKVGGLRGRRDHRHQAVGRQPGRHQGHDQRRLRAAARGIVGHGAPDLAAVGGEPLPVAAPGAEQRARDPGRWRGRRRRDDERGRPRPAVQHARPKARKGLQGVLRGFGGWYVGQSDNLQDTFKYLAPSLGNLSR